VNNSDKIATDFARVVNASPTNSEKRRVEVLGESERGLPFIIFLGIGGLFVILSGGVIVIKNWNRIKIWLEN
jgi:hypothetical protein